MHPPQTREEPAAAVDVHLLGLVDFDAGLALQQRLVYETSGRADGRIALLVCEHPAAISVGRQGSWAHIRLDREGLERRQLAVRWLARGGGCVMHAPGQLAVYPIVPLAWHGWSVGEYLNRLQGGLQAAIAELGVAGQTRAGRHGLWGRGGLLAAFGIAVRHGVASHGAFLNVHPALRPFRHVNMDPAGGAATSSLVAERRQPIRMGRAREAVIRRLAEAFDAPRYHLFTGHPLFDTALRDSREPAARAG